MHYLYYTLSPWNTPVSTLWLMLIFLWTIPWKAVALWKAARSEQLGWFIALLLINTAGVLEIIYIFGFSKEKNNTTTPSEQSH